MSMTPDYTINDAYHDGFEAGLLYVIRYFQKDRPLTDEEILRLGRHLELMKPWKSDEEWLELIHRNMERWE